MDIDKELVPEHVAIIMDGNRRWAKSNSLPISMGHKQGAKTLEKIITHAMEIGIKYITVYAFSTENWKRSKEEVDTLMKLLQTYLGKFAKKADSQNIKINIMGDPRPLSEKLKNTLIECVEKTKNNTGITLNFGLNYGGRDEIIRAIKSISEDVKEGIISLDDINEELVSNRLYTKGQPDPDLLIRTSGEIRLSNFLPWQSSYSEFLFVEKNWPEFDEKDLENAIIEFLKRTRKFGAN